MSLGTRVQLSLMMFLEYFIWGVWFVTLATYLNEIKFEGSQIAAAYSTTAWAAFVAPLFVGMIADRFFSAQKVLGIMHLVGGLLIYAASRITEPGVFFWVLLGHAICYMPTMALTNTISFNQMSDPGKQFPGIRVLGTLGWIAAGLLIGFLKLEKTAVPMQIACAVSIAMAMYSFTLPATPPKSVGKKVSISDVLGLDAIRLMKDWSFAIFVIASLLICIPLSFYYSFANLFFNQTPMQDPAAKQTMGQMSEVFFMLVMPFFFSRLGVKKMLLFGMAAWAVRYFLFAYGATSNVMMMLYVGILLHGICYDFFFVTGQIYVDNKAPKEIQASAQGFIGLVTYGAGMVIGNYIAGLVADHYTVNEAFMWKEIWMVPAVMSVAVMVGFALMFWEKAPAPAREMAPVAAEK